MKTIIVTGAGRGFGYHVARFALQAGMQVIPVLRDLAEGRRIKEIAPERCFPVIGDVTSDDTKKMLGLSIRQSGSIVHALINNAGTPGKGCYFDSATSSELIAEFSVHCVGALLCSQACAPYFDRTTTSSIINITSRLGSISRAASGEFSHIRLSYSYRIAKAAQNMLSVCLASESALTGVTVCGLHPGTLSSGCGMPDAQTSPEDAGARFIKWLFTVSPEMHNRCFDLDGGEMSW